MARPNIYEGEFQMVMEQLGLRGRFLARAAGAQELGATVYELDAGARGFRLHAHYGNEELFIVLRGTPTLRTHEGEQELAPGEVVACPRGRAGTHTIMNRSEEQALVLALSTANSPDIVLYEDDTVGVATRHPFAPPAPDGDEGIIAMFRTADDLRRSS